MDRPHYKFWPQRLPRSITVPATSLWHNLKTNAERYPNKAALVFFGSEITYSEFAAQAERLAGTLHALGVKRGDRVREVHAWLAVDQAGHEIDFGFERTAIGCNHVVAHRHLGIAAAIEANLAAIGHVEVDRNALTAVESGKPCGMVVGCD